MTCYDFCGRESSQRYKSSLSNDSISSSFLRYGNDSAIIAEFYKEMQMC